MQGTTLSASLPPSLSFRLAAGKKMPLFQEKAALKLSATFAWGFRSMMLRRRRPPPLLCGSASQIFSPRASSMITHLINREFNHIIGCRFPRYNCSLSSAAAAAGEQIAPSSSDDEQKPTVDASVSSSQVRFFELVRPHVVEILNGLRRELNLALEAGAQGRAADACAAIVRVFCGSGVETESIPLLSEVMSSHKDSGFDVLAMFGLPSSDGQNRGGNVVIIDEAFDTVIRSYAHLKMPDRAAQAFFRLCARGYVPCIDTCNFLMDLLVGCGDMESVKDVYSQIKRSQVIRPNLCTFRNMMKGLCSRGEFFEVVYLMKEMKQEGVVPDSSILSELVCGLCDHGMPYSGFNLLTKYAGIFGDSMTTISYNLVISGLCEMKAMRQAEFVLEVMVKNGVPPDVYTYASLIERYCSSANTSRVLSLLDQMDTRGIETNCAIQSSILHCFSELGKHAEVLELFEKFKKSGQIVDKVLCNIAIDAQCKLGKMEEAVEMFQEMKGCGLVPDKIHYSTLINGYCRQGEIDKAWKTFNCMIDERLEPDVVTYNLLASGFAKSGFVEETLGLLSHMLDHGVEPNSVTHANVVEGLL